MKCLFVLCIFSALNSFATTPDWSEGFQVPEGGRSNPYLLSESVYQTSIQRGRAYALEYPVSVTGILPPFQPLRRAIEEKPKDPLQAIVQNFFHSYFNISDFSGLLDWIGLNPYPQSSDSGIYQVPYPNGVRPDYPMGFGLMERNGAVGFTLSCATCHSSKLFGKSVLGMTNRFPKANETFRKIKFLSHFINDEMFAETSDATPAEVALMMEVKQNLKSVGAKDPVVLGLDTSLAQVALSLARRNQDPWATKNPHFEKRPRSDFLDQFPADSKPAVWWNLKYKNRWLSDGSVVSGNPIFTNLLWNEIGRGVDLYQLNDWLEKNSQIIQDLTTAVFSTEAPRMTDFFSEDRIDLEKAQKGEIHFNRACAKCHGVYVKAWSIPDNLTKIEKIKTIQVRYPQKTFVRDVGTDSHRYEGMISLEQLNDLEISKRNNTVVKSQTGYVPPPLVGIWARWPYFHNNSVPNLCALLTRSEDRPRKFYMGEAIDPEIDFDFDCNGYPTGDKTPESWKTKDFKYKTNRPGQSNQGHDEGIFLKDGKEIFSWEEKKELIHYLQTL